MKAWTDDESQKDGEVVLEMSAAEALVFYDWLQRFNNRDSDESRLPAERRVMWDIECLLEKALVAPLRKDYAAELSKARSVVGE